MKHKLKSKIAGRNINNLRYANGTTLIAETEELKSLLLKVKEKSEKFGLKLNIQKTKIMASSPITSWQIDGETVETVADFIFQDPKSLHMVTVAMKLKDAYSLEEKLINLAISLDSLLKNRDITLPTKVCLVKAMIFPVVMYGCESCTVKTLESPLDCKEIQPVHPKGDSPGCSLEELMLKLKLQYFGHLMQRTESIEKTLMLGKIEGVRRRG